MKTPRLHFPVLFAALCVLLLFQQCSARKGGGAAASPAADSVRTADSAEVKSSKVTSVLLTYEERQGKVLFTKYCSVCHGTDGKGDGFNAFNLDPRPRDLSDKQYMSAFTEERLYQTIDLGGRGMNKSPSMPSWGGRLNRQEIKYLIAFIQSMTPK